MGALKLALFVVICSFVTMICIQYYAKTSNVGDEEEEISFSLSLSSLIDYFVSHIAFGSILSVPTSSHKGGSKVDQHWLFSKEELKTFKYKYLAIAGEVFDVSTDKGIRHYGQEGHYNFFTGVDGTKAFVTGEFTEEGLTDDIAGLDASSIKGIEDWRLMYHKDYNYKGKVIGRFYNSDGEETEMKKQYRKKLVEAEKKKTAEKEFNKLYPPCNSEFKNKASRIWCSTLSGGINRPWVGVPRKLFTAGTGSFRCACIRTTGPPSSDMSSKDHNNRGDLDNPNLREYDNCEPTSVSCPL